MSAAARKRAVERLERRAVRQLQPPPDPDALFLELPDADFLEIVVPGCREIAARALPGPCRPDDYWQTYWSLAAAVVTAAEAGDFPTARQNFRQFSQTERRLTGNRLTTTFTQSRLPLPCEGRGLGG